MPGAASIAARALPGIVIGQEETITVTMGASNPVGTYGFNFDTFDNFGSISGEFSEGGTSHMYNYWVSAKSFSFKKTSVGITQRFRYYDLLIDGDSEPFLFNYPDGTLFVSYSGATGTPTGAKWSFSLGNLGFDRADPTGWTVGTGTRNVTVRKQAITTTRVTVTKGSSDTNKYVGWDSGDYTAAVTASFGSVDVDVLPNGAKIRAIVFEELGTNDTMHIVIDGKWTGLPDAYGASSPFLGMQWEGQSNLDTPSWGTTATYNATNNTTTFEFRNQFRNLPWQDAASGGGDGWVDIHTPARSFVAEPETKVFTITQGSFGAGFGRGFDIDEPAGSRSPTAFDEGSVLEAAYLFNVGADYPFTIKIQGEKGAGFVTSITPQGGGTYTSPSYVYGAGEDTSEYIFTTSNAGLATTWDGAGNVTCSVTIQP